MSPLFQCSYCKSSSRTIKEKEYHEQVRCPKNGKTTGQRLEAKKRLDLKYSFK